MGFATTATTVRTTVEVEVHVIVPVHNAANTVEESIRSAMSQVLPAQTLASLASSSPSSSISSAAASSLEGCGGVVLDDRLYQWSVKVCCYDDGSTDKSWEILHALELEYNHHNHQQGPEQPMHMSSPDSKAPLTTTSKKASTPTLLRPSTTTTRIPSELHIARAPDGISRGAGYARNRAVELGAQPATTTSSPSPPRPRRRRRNVKQFLCLLDSDDTMHPHRVYEQTKWFLAQHNCNTSQQNGECHEANGNETLHEDDEFPAWERTLLGCTFDRDPPDSTWHYAQWANQLSDEQLYLQQFRELTLLQPTWMMYRSWFHKLDGYIEAPVTTAVVPRPEASSLLVQSTDQTAQEEDNNKHAVRGGIEPQERFNELTKDNDAVAERTNCGRPLFRLIHPVYDTNESLRLAEDLRFFYAHLHAGGKLALLRNTAATTRTVPLVTYRHRVGQSQSSQTSRKLLMQLRVWALEHLVLRVHPQWQKRQTRSHREQDKEPTQVEKLLSKQESQDAARFKPLPELAPPSTSVSLGASSCGVGPFCVWGGGRDGKEFIKALSPDLRSRVVCLADVDEKKIATGFYVNRDIAAKIPIVHFSLLARDAKIRQQLQMDYQQQHHQQPGQPLSTTANSSSRSGHDAGERGVANFGRIQKGQAKKSEGEEQKVVDLEKREDKLALEQQVNPRPDKRIKTAQASSSLKLLHSPKLDPGLIETFPQLPVIVCVAMYRTGGALEHNVRLIGRTEGKDLWHVV